MPLFETSAKDDDKTDHVEAIFVTLAHKIATFTKPMMASDVEKKPILNKDSKRDPTASTSLLGDEDKSSHSCCYVA